MGRNKKMIPMLTGALQVYGAFQELNAPDINYDILGLSATQKELQADNMELEVEQEANRLREEYIQAVGSAQYGAARRGVKVGEGNIQEDIEESAGAVGKDIQTQRKNLEYKKGQLKRGASRLRTAQEAQKEIGQYERIGRAASGIRGAMSDYQKTTRKTAQQIALLGG